MSKIILLATINSIIVTASFLLNFVYSTATKDLWSKKTTRYSYKRCHNFEDYYLWKGQATKEELCKNFSTFLELKHLKDDEPGDELGSWLS